MAKGHIKGPDFERLIAKRLSHWITSGERDDLFTRNVLSGGQFTFSSRKGKARGRAGDIVSSDPLAFPFCEKVVVECKHWRDLDLISFFHQRGELFQAICKVERQARDCGKNWMLIARQNNKPVLLFIDPALLKTFYGQILDTVLFVPNPNEGGVCYILDLDAFTSAVPFEQFLSNCAKETSE